MAGPVADLQEFDTKMKGIDQKKRDRQTNQTMSQTTNNLNESMYTQQQTMRGTNVGDQSMVSEAAEQMVPAAKRALDKAEYDRRKVEEEEMKRIIEEERQKQLDAYGGVDDNLKAIPIQRILELKLRQKKLEVESNMSKTMGFAENTT
jgi:hypothetical protein